MSKEKTVTIHGKKFEVPGGSLYCKKCKTTNFIYDDMKPPYFCADCGKPLKADGMQEIDLKNCNTNTRRGNMTQKHEGINEE
jgi:rRNA maturation endonuclease Nob1